jgi:HSP20 family protein
MNSLIRWEPFEDLWPFRRVVSDGAWTHGNLALDMYETDKDVVVKLALPGVKPEDIDVSLLGDVLTIKGEVKSEEHAEKRDYIHQEQRYGQFERRVVLPAQVVADEAKAEFEHGVLTLNLPKAAEAQAKSVPVKAK